MPQDDSPSDDPVPLTPAAEPVDAAFVPDEYDQLRANRRLAPSPFRRPDRPMTRSRLRMWLMIGGALWAIGLAGWLVLLVQGCEPDGDAGPPVKKRK